MIKIRLNQEVKGISQCSSGRNKNPLALAMGSVKKPMQIIIERIKFHMKTRSDVKLGENEVLEKEVVLEKISLLKSILGVDKIGLAGSYSKGNAKKYSDIDIVFDCDLPLESIELVRLFVKNELGKKSDVLCLPAMKLEDDELDNFSESLGLGVVECSVYKNVMREVIWCE
ncbi:nucleotidyltransferase family protein [Mediterraneibacter gnavus]|uniref:nucleotidyltransferase family protein n=1 Tax=Mediterraneibacter gnavus TaxID=33038 RepID=UPI00232FF616|nr:nucleotidyltransferase domain-containing protein [Mediterraneibacter gnavus]MDB8712069.1 nucleotidyltransferase domain-containing protein [Mediterraneibacter gnavus]MDB8715094.1 nucleotidyltransferase domain-containing protein [Mediterraneibacter gnavus]